MNKSKTIELDKILPEDVINVIDDIVTHLMADELHPAKKEEPTIEEITENPNMENDDDSSYDDDDVPDLE